MSIKLFILQKLSLFFMLSTLITVAISVIGTALDPGARFGYDALLSPLFYAACCVIPTFVTYSRRELTLKELVGRMVLEWILIEAVVLYIAYSSPVIDTGRISVVLTLAVSVFVIYLLSRLISWLQDSAEARKLNDELLRFQKESGGQVR